MFQRKGCGRPRLRSETVKVKLALNENLQKSLLLSSHNKNTKLLRKPEQKEDLLVVISRFKTFLHKDIFSKSSKCILVTRWILTTSGLNSFKQKIAFLVYDVILISKLCFECIEPLFNFPFLLVYHEASKNRSNYR